MKSRLLAILAALLLPSLRALAAVRKVPVADFNQHLLSELKWLSNDGVHPTTAGCDNIARFVAEAVAPLVKKHGRREKTKTV